MTCYLCHHENTLLFQKNGYNIYHCNHCNLEQTNLNQDYDTFVTQHYSKEYFTGDEDRNAYTDYKKSKPLIVRNMTKYLKQIQQFKPQGKLLDIGCALGYFVEMATNNGYDAYGIDPSSYAINEARKLLADKVQQGTLKTISYPPNTFDIIVMLDVFEHLNDPLEELEHIRKLLKDDGVLLIATGDTDSLFARIMKRKWTFYNPPQHLFFFNRTNATQMLKQTNYKIEKIFSVGKWLSLKYVLHLAKTTGESKLGAWLYQLIEKNKLGEIPLYLALQDNMIIIAKKQDL